MKRTRIISIFSFLLLSDVTAGYAGDAVDAQEWIAANMGGDDIHAAVLEYETDGASGKRHEFAIYDAPCLYRWQAFGGEKDHIERSLWSSGGIVTEKTWNDGQVVLSSAENTNLKDALRNVRLFLGQASETRFDGLSRARRMPDEAGRKMYLLDAGDGNRVRYELQADFPPLPLAKIEEFPGDGVLRHISYGEWLVQDGFYFPGEVSIEYIRIDGGEVPPKSEWKLVQIHSINQSQPFMAFVPMLGMPENVQEWQCDKSGNAIISIARPGVLHEKYGEFFPTK